MQSELALQRLQEVREVVDGDIRELVDTLATVIILQQDVANPMHGAKVTYYTRPETDRHEVDPENAPDPDGDEWNWQWTKGYPRDKDEQPRYWFREKVDPDAPDLIAHRGIVYEPFVADAPDGKYWDPEREEYRRPDDYPMGTVNLIYAAHDGREFGAENYVVDVEVATSVTPADGEPGPAQYTPGWDSSP